MKSRVEPSYFQRLEAIFQKASVSNMTSPKNWHWIVRYAIAPVAVALALGCRLALNPFLGDASPFMYFFVAIIVSGWLGGLGPGLTATLLSMLAVDYFYLPPVGWILLSGGLKEIIQVLSFGVLGTVVSVIVARMQHKQRDAENATSVAGERETETRQADEALRQSEACFRGTFENAAIGMTHIDLNGNWILVNQKFCDLVGYSHEELVGKKFWELTHPDDIELDAAPYTQLIRGNINHYEVEKRYITKDRRAVWVYVSRSLQRDIAGRPLYSITNVVDITERKRVEKVLKDSERRLADIIEFLPDATFALDNAGRIIAWNKAMENLTRTPAVDVLGKGNHEHTYRLYGKRIPCLADKLLTGEIAEWTFSNVIVENEIIKAETYIPLHKPGGIWLAIKVAPMYDAPGNIVGVIDSCRDITERKHTDEALQAANERLTDADQRKDEFLAMLAHELRNPLAPIRYAAQMLQMTGPTPEQIQKQHELIDRQVSHMGRLLDDLLDVSRITRGKITLKREILDLRTVAAQAINSLRPMIEGRGQYLAFEEPSSPLPVDGDPTRLEQIIRNLLHNANKYTEAGGCIKISLGLESKNEHAWRAMVCVIDSGIGIAPEILPHVFEAFVQAKQEIDRSQGGLGIGLSMVKSLVQMHGGSVEAHSAGLGHGSEFIVRLPLADGFMNVLKNISVTEAQSQVAGSTPRRVLVVDDNEDSAASLGDLLNLWGHDVQAAHDGKQALAVARRWQPEIILLDIGLPGMDGYEVARRLREEPVTASAFLVALTGYGQDEDRRRAQEAGFDRHLTKPVELGQLQDLINKE